MSACCNQNNEETWISIPADGKKIHPLTRRQFKRWALVLDAMKIDYRQENSWRGVQLQVRSEDLDRAMQQIQKFEEENHNWPPPPPEESTQPGTILVTLSVVILVASFHNLTQYLHPIPYIGSPDWHELGSLHAGKLRQGEIWRTITALTLHVDTRHVMGNAVVLTLFIEQLRKRYGSGNAWLLCLLCGMGGNLINGMLQPWHHQAVGASTAVFGLLGVLGADSFVRYRHALLRRWWGPLAAALALLGFLGTSGANTDLGAHLWGFVVGVALGLALSVNRHTALVTPTINRLTALITSGIVLTAWSLAL